jgi:hypothetical protein
MQTQVTVEQACSGASGGGAGDVAREAAYEVVAGRFT